jgi:hypothetical protein
MTEINARPKAKISPLLIALGCLGLLASGVAAYFFFPNPVDWTISYLPALNRLLSGANPYTGGLPFYNAPWTLLPLIPFGVLPYRLGVACLFVANLAAFVYIGLRRSNRPLPVIALLCSLPVITCILFGQIDGFILLGLFMPRPLGLIFLGAKPQLGAAVALFWAIEAWRSGGWKKTARLIAPVAVVYLVSFAIFGLWPLNLDLANLIATEHNTSLWPGSLMIGLPLLVYALRQRNENFALMAAPFLAPYVAPQSWSIALIGLMSNDVEMAAAALASWGLLIFRLLG